MLYPCSLLIRPLAGRADQATVVRAVVVPPPGPQGLPRTGRFRRAGTLFRNLALFRDDALFTGPATFAKARKHVSRRHLWCGVLQHHFGHFLCEGTRATGRLTRSRPKVWSSCRAAPADLNRSHRLPARYHSTFWGEAKPIRSSPSRPRSMSLVVAGPGFGLGQISEARPNSTAFAKAHVAPDIAPGGHRNCSCRAARCRSKAAVSCSTTCSMPTWPRLATRSGNPSCISLDAAGLTPAWCDPYCGP